ncbi:restriction endonuclease subunit S [Paludicola sp. MB14-C6]|uniref:restriction endonuclease subunit S n=1 Tax=Paludihabitans sp. MB14-C6 TaxID=3070656 RepID=UPI0027DB9C3E|nr:restriction endonuclease subunit S [Paludicola sp. MB14-C6]WMJ23709.1 restriction endonuclease subunit S [Paludicola sp. MB14-C6]
MSKWQMVRLGDICKITSGGTPSKAHPEYYENGTIPWIKTGDLKNKYVSYNVDKITESGLKNSSAKMFPEGTLLIAMYGATIGACSILSFDACTNQACAAFLSIKNLDVSFLYYYLRSQKENFIKLGVGGAQPNISATILKDYTIPLPPIEVQQKIAKTLDAASELLAMRKQQLQELDNLIQSTFYDMFGDPVTNEKGWEVGTIRDIVSEVKYGTSKAATEFGQYKYLRMNNITYSGSMDYTNLKYINLEEKEAKKYLVVKGDVLFNRTNSKELVGKTAVFKEDEPMVIAGYLIKIKVNDRANSEFLSGILNSKYGKNTLTGMCKAIIGQANINAQELQNIKITLPPLSLQNKFAEIVTKIEEQKELVQKAIDESQYLFDSLMSEYFE